MANGCKGRKCKSSILQGCSGFITRFFFFFGMYLMIKSRQKKSENFRCELLKKYNPF